MSNASFSTADTAALRLLDEIIINVGNANPLATSLKKLRQHSEQASNDTARLHEHVEQLEEWIEQGRLARIEAEAANRAKDEFLATVAHELRLPLSGIMGWVGLAQMGILTPEERLDALNKIGQAASSQARLIEDIIDISRIISGRLRIRWHPVALKAAINAAVDIVRPAAERKGVKLQVDLEEPVPVLMGDNERLIQVLINLLGNGVKFTPKDGRVLLELELAEERVKIKVSDNGKGISPDFLPHVFEKFRQFEVGSDPAQTGLGLGLAIVWQIVQLHGGSITAASDGIGRGATFTILLPTGYLRTPVDDTEPRAASPPSTVASTLRRMQAQDTQQPSESGAIRTIGTAHNITDRKQTDEELRQRELLLAEAQELAHVGSWNWDLHNDVLTWSDEHYRIFGLDREDGPMTLERGLSVIHPDDLPRVRRVVEEALRDGTPYECSLRLLRRDGSLRFVCSRGRTVYDRAGKPVRMYGTVQDVTDRERAEEALRIANEQLDLAIRGSNIGIWDVDLAVGSDYRRDPVRFINVWEPLGYDPAEFPKDASASRALGHPDDLIRVDAAIAACLAGEMDEIRVENRIRHKDGSYHWLLTLGQAMRDVSGRPVRLIGTVLDITDRKRAEEALRESEARFRELAQAVPSLVWSCALDKKCDYVNPQFMRYTGKSEAELLDDWRRDTIHPDDHAAMFEGWEHSVRTGEPAEFEVRLRRHDGAWRWFQVRAALVRNEQGQPITWFGTNTDIDDLKRAEDELRRGKEFAEQANRAKDKFLAVVSHELRTPLTGIMLWSQVLGSETLQPGVEGKAIRAIRKGAKAQQLLIEDLLDVSRILAGEMRVNAGEIELRPVVRAAVEIVRPDAEARHIRIEEVLERHPGRVQADSDRIRQVMQNLLTNAIKFTPDGGQVKVRLRRAGTVVEIQVSDSGQGIAPEFLPHVFERFRQADSSDSRRHRGLGLGLTIARELVELHGGTIRAESAGRDQGATFTIELPVIDSPAAEAVTGPSPRPTDPLIQFVPSLVLRGVRALVVEDDTTTQLVIQHLLEKSEAEVTVVDNAADALREFESSLRGRRFDVLLSDIGLPETNGYILMGRIRSMELQRGEERSIPAVALTAYARPQDRAAALLAGFTTCLVKPVAAASLVAMVAKCVGRDPVEP